MSRMLKYLSITSSFFTLPVTLPHCPTWTFLTDGPIGIGLVDANAIPPTRRRNHPNRAIVSRVVVGSAKRGASRKAQR